MAQNDDFGTSEYVQTMSSIVFPLITGIGVIGNVMVIVVILKTKEIHNSTTMFLANLAIIDLINLLLYGAVSFLNLFSPDFLNLSEVACKLIPGISETLVNVSALTVFAIGYERYYAVCQPHKARYICTKRWACRICLLAWSIAVLFSSPYASIMVYKQGAYINGTYRGPCQMCTDILWIKAFIITGVSLFYILPLIMLTVIFLTIAQHLKRASLAPNVNITAIRHRRQLVKLLATVVFCFFIFLLPSRAFNLLLVSVSRETHMRLDTRDIHNWFLFSRAMINVHSALNPILYNFMSRRFKEAFRSLCCGTRWQTRGKLGEKSTKTTEIVAVTLSN